jgi:hypothetical protein
MFNPKLKDFLEENKNKTLIGFFWSMFWRFYVFLLGIYLACLVFIGIVFMVIVLFSKR